MEGAALDYVRYLVALIFVIVLMFGLAHIIRRYLPGAIPLTKGSKGKDKRLKLEEIITVGGKDRLSLVSCDDQEYLVLTGSEQPLLIPLGRENSLASPLDPTGKGANNTGSNDKDR